MSRFDVLYEGYCDGTLTPAEQEEFLAALRDPALRARFVELSAFDALVGDELGVSTTEAKLSSRSLRAIRIARRPRAERSHAGPWIAAGLAAAALLILIALGFSGGSKPPRAPKPVDARRILPPFEPPRAVEAPPAPPSPRREEREPEPLVVPPLPRPQPPAPLPPPKPQVLPPAPAPKDVVPAPKLPEKATVAAIAHLEAVAGKVNVATAASCLEADAGFALAGEESVETSAAGAAWIRFTDGTRVTLGADTLLARLAEPAGKTLRLDRGTVWIEAPKQLRPMTVSCPHAEAVVLGTEFSLTAGAGYTRIDVREGRVRFSRGVSALVVGAGQYAVSQPGQDLSLKSGPAAWKAPASGLLSWLKADAVRTAGKGVTSWTDQSTLGNHATQPQAGCQPTVVDGLRPALKFDGLDDHLELPSGMSEFRAGLSAFVVARVAAAPATLRFIDLGAGPSCDNVVFGRKDGALAFWAYANGQTRGKVEVPGAVAADQLAVYAVVAQSGGRALLFRNGAPVGGGQTSSLSGEARKSNYVGKSNMAGEPPFRGEIAELLLYQRAVTDPERQHIDAYLWAKYLDPTLPPAAPRGPQK